MTKLILYKENNPNLFALDRAIQELTESLPQFQPKWESYIQATYKDYQAERLDYVDISEHSRFIRDLILANNAENLDLFFNKVELILTNCDSVVENFMIVGLIESIQNNCSGDKINIWTGFDRWLKPTTKKHWDNLICSWEGNDAIEKYKQKNPGNNELIK